MSELALLFLDDLPQQMEAIHRAVERSRIMTWSALPTD